MAFAAASCSPCALALDIARERIIALAPGRFTPVNPVLAQRVPVGERYGVKVVA